MADSHTTQIAVERSMIQAYGITRTQARRALHQAVATKERQQEVPVPISLQGEPKEKFHIDVQEVKSGPKKEFAVDSKVAVNDVAQRDESGDPGVITNETVIVNNNVAFVTLSASISGGQLTITVDGYDTTNCT